MNDLFFVDASQNVAIDYDQLLRDVAAAESIPKVVVYEDCYALFKTLLVAIERDATLVLVDEAADCADAESLLEQFGGLEANEWCSASGMQGIDANKSHSASATHGNNANKSHPASATHGIDAKEWCSAGATHGNNAKEWCSAGATHGNNANKSHPAGATHGGATHGDATHGDAKHGDAKHGNVTQGKKGRIGLFTSGTTGKPKLVLHALDSLTRAVRVGDKHRTDVWGLAYHPAHFAGLQVFFQALANRNRIVRLYGLESAQMHSAIEQERITHLSATPTLMRLLVSDPQSHAKVTSVTLGGERMEADLLGKLTVMFPNAKLRNVYASTEVGSVLASDGELFSVPTAYDGLIKIMDGELAVHRSLLAASLQVTMRDDYYVTGDCVEVVQDKPLRFRFVARRSDFINVGGYKVNPHEVERHLLDMPEVVEAAVYGKSNSVVGNLVCCDLVLCAGQRLTAKEIYARLESKLAVYKIPRVVQAVESLRMTSTGKRQRDS